MVNFEFSNISTEKSEKFNRLNYSVTKKFRDYLLEYIYISKENKKKFEAYYKFRSKIVQVGMLLNTERFFEKFLRKIKTKN